MAKLTDTLAAAVAGQPSAQELDARVARAVEDAQRLAGLPGLYHCGAEELCCRGAMSLFSQRPVADDKNLWNVLAGGWLCDCRQEQAKAEERIQAALEQECRKRDRFGGGALAVHVGSS